MQTTCLNSRPDILSKKKEIGEKFALHLNITINISNNEPYFSEPYSEIENSRSFPQTAGILLCKLINKRKGTKFLFRT